MARSSRSFEKAIDLLTDYYGREDPYPSPDPFELILWENIGYLVNDERRREAFEAFKQNIGTHPESILRASRKSLHEVAKIGGMLPEMRVQKLLTIARIAKDEFGGHLNSVVKMPLTRAKKALKMFPSIGDPGAEKVLLFSESYPVMALESNGLRVLLRLGFGHEHKSYSATYRSVQKALEGQFKEDIDRLIQAHLLLRRHGQQLCRRTRPICQPCPLKKTCGYYAGGGKL